MADIETWIDSLIEFPQMSYIKPILATVILLLAVSISFDLIFSLFGRFFER